MVKITYLGQAGFLFEYKETKIMIDPYLSNSVAKFEPRNERRFPVDERFFSIVPNVLLFTHNHGDHYDEETVKRFVTEESRITVLSPYSVWHDVRKFGGNNNFILFDKGTSVTVDGVVFTAVKAVHSDKDAIGVVMEIEGEKYYITGDTLYSEEVFSSLPQGRYKALFLPINGIGNNMNVADAKRFLERIQADFVVPMHIGLFDDLSGELLQVKNRVIAENFKEVKLR